MLLAAARFNIQFLLRLPGWFAILILLVSTKQTSPITLLKRRQGFTIVELLIVIVVIAILAAITIVSFNGIRARADRAALETDAKSVFTQLEIALMKDGIYPADLSQVKKDDASYSYTYSRTVAPDSFCVSVEDIRGTSYFFTNTNQKLQSGVCAGQESEPLLAVGNDHACALIDDVLKCWGRNNMGQLGNGSTAANSTTPVVVNATGVLAGKKITKLGAGFNYTCVLADGIPYCWGTYENGVLGDNGVATAAQRTPTAVYTAGELNGKQVSDLSVGSYSACVLANGAPYCWGEATYGKLGNGTTTGNRAYPVAVTTSGVLSGKTITMISSGASDNCVVANGAIYCWGRVAAYSRSTPVAFAQNGSLAGKTVTSMITSAGNVGHCALADGAVHCVGAGTAGQLGDGLNTTSSVPVAVTTTGDLSGKTIQKLAKMGGTNNCAIDTEHALYCWGSGKDGSLGTGNTTNLLVPTRITNSALSAGVLKEVAGNDSSTCGIVGSSVYCWGAGDYGILGNGGTSDSFPPVTVSW